METSEHGFLHVVCQLDMGLTQYPFLSPLKIFLRNTYVCVMEPLEYTSIKRNTMVMPVALLLVLLGRFYHIFFNRSRIWNWTHQSYGCLSRIAIRVCLS